MRQLTGYISQYIRLIDVKSFVVTSLLLAMLIWLNYTYGMDQYISSLNDAFYRFAAYSFLILTAFGGAYMISFVFRQLRVPDKKFFYFLLIISVFLFALKMAIRFSFVSEASAIDFPGGKFWILSLHWPVKALVLLLFIIFIWKAGNYKGAVAGLYNNKDIKHYVPLLLLMIPLIYLAAANPDFQSSYPRVKNIFFLRNEIDNPLPWYLLYEIFYGIDFFTIELFFRGFLVLAFVRYAGIHAILPMAAFYCVIHFGKPLPECISSFFGGLILGAVVYHSRSIWGGLLVHLGIAWVMEVLVWART